MQPRHPADKPAQASPPSSSFGVQGSGGWAPFKSLTCILRAQGKLLHCTLSCEPDVSQAYKMNTPGTGSVIAQSGTKSLLLMFRG